MNVAIPSEKSPSRGSGAAIAIALALGVLTIVWHHRQSVAELAAIPVPERTRLYQRTLATLRSTCTSVGGQSLNDYCQEQAMFLIQFPECDAQCRDTCQRHISRPTK